MGMKGQRRERSSHRDPHKYFQEGCFQKLSVLSLLTVGSRPQYQKHGVTHLTVCFSASVLLIITFFFSLPFVGQCVCILTSVCHYLWPFSP